MKKKALAICLCIVLALGSVAATIAYLTDDDSAVNTFIVGKVDISLSEYQINDEGILTETTTEGFDYKLIPGNKYSKVPIVTVAADSEPCWLYVTVDNQLNDVNGKDIEGLNVDGIKTIEEQMAICGWTNIGTYTLEGKEQAVYAKEGKDNIGQPDIGYKVFDYFTIKGDGVTNADIDAAKTKVIVIKAYAIQADGFDTAVDAWEKAHTQF